MNAESTVDDRAIDLDFQMYAKLFWSRRRTIFLCITTISILSLSYSYLTTPIYQATSTLEIERQGPDVLTFQDVMAVDPAGYRAFYQSQYKNLRSHTVMRLAAYRIDLQNNPELALRKGSPLGRSIQAIKSIFTTPPPEDLDRKTLRFLDKNLTITPIRNSQHVEISFRDRSPELAQDIANAIAYAFQEFNSTNRYDTTEQASEFLVKDVAIQQKRIADLENKLQEISADKELLALSDGTQDISEQALADLNGRLSSAKAALALAEARHETIRLAASDALPEVQTSLLIHSLKQEYASIERRHSQLAKKFKPGWPALNELEEELSIAGTRLDTETNSIANQVRNAAKTNYDQVLAEVRNLDAQVEIQKTEVKRVNLDAIAYSALKEEIYTERQVLNDKIKRRSETETSTRLQSTEASNIRIIDLAELPDKPVSPKKLLNLILGLVLGTGLGVGVALLLHYVDNSIKTEQDVSQYAPGVAVLGHIPNLQATSQMSGYSQKSKNKKKKKLGPKPALAAADKFLADRACHDDPLSIFSEAFKNMRTSLLLSSPDHPPRYMAVTSPNPSEGKSTICLNLAIVLAQQGKKVLVIDADLRKPRIHKSFKLPNTMGLSNFLSGNAGPENLIQKSDIPGLDFITSGPIPPNPSELIDSPLIQELLHHLSENLGYDHVLFDSPPALQVADSVILASKIDGIVLVVSAGETPRESLTMAVNRLAQSHGHVFGCILNGVTESSGYYQGDKYRYHYKYHRNRSDDADEQEAPPERKRPTA